MGDIMGATTWTYPKSEISFEELIEMLNALRNGFAGSYEAYLTKVEGFSTKPVIGEKWPKDGFYLPTQDVFMAEANKQASFSTLHHILNTSNAEK